MIVELLIVLLIFLWILIFLSYLYEEAKAKKDRKVAQEKLSALLKTHDENFKKKED
jgi:hypothetical protein